LIVDIKWREESIHTCRKNFLEEKAFSPKERKSTALDMTRLRDAGWDTEVVPWALHLRTPQGRLGAFRSMGKKNW